MSRRSSIHSLGRNMQFFNRLAEENFFPLTEPHNLQQLYHMMEEVLPAFAE